MGNDPYLVAYKVTFYSRGKVHSELVWAQNDLRDPRDDEYDNEHGDHYRLWRFMPDGRRVTSFRCRYGEWVSTAAVINVPPQPEELRELEELRVRVAAAEEAAAMNEMRAAEAEHRSMQAQRDAANMRDRLEATTVELAEARAEVTRLTPKPENVPF